MIPCSCGDTNSDNSIYCKSCGSLLIGQNDKIQLILDEVCNDHIDVCFNTSYYNNQQLHNLCTAVEKIKRTCCSVDTNTSCFQNGKWVYDHKHGSCKKSEAHDMIMIDDNVQNYTNRNGFIVKGMRIIVASI
jgi:hypothetical protein